MGHNKHDIVGLYERGMALEPRYFMVSISHKMCFTRNKQTKLEHLNNPFLLIQTLLQTTVHALLVLSYNKTWKLAQF
jgi:hypothetical protein